MLTHSLFRVTCICGEELRSEGKVGTCPTCKCEFRIEWPADYEGAQPKQKEPVPAGERTAAA